MFKKRFDESIIHGSVEPGFEEVEEEFKRNFAERGEIGAACAAYHKGKKVVDLWGGYRDEKTRAPWEEDTIVLVFSTTKGLAAMTLALVHSCGLLDYDEKVATYWPEFGQQGKEKITMRQLLAHQSGLCAVDEPLDFKKLADLDAVATAIAKQKPAWEPGTRHGYHTWSIGFYENELIRRLDPQHRSLGQFFQDEIAKPLGLEFYIGLPSNLPDSRLAMVKPLNILQVISELFKGPSSFILSNINPKSIAIRSLNPKISLNGFNKRDFLSVELAAGNGVGQVRSIAKAYNVFANGGSELGIKEETLDALTSPPIPPSSGINDVVRKVDICYSLGYMKPCGDFRFGVSQKSFGMDGLGGSFGFADPDAQVGYAYAPNKLNWNFYSDPREIALRNAFYRCLKRMVQ